jgi:hypothetical protein
MFDETQSETAQESKRVVIEKTSKDIKKKYLISYAIIFASLFGSLAIHPYFGFGALPGLIILAEARFDQFWNHD